MVRDIGGCMGYRGDVGSHLYVPAPPAGGAHLHYTALGYGAGVGCCAQTKGAPITESCLGYTHLSPSHTVTPTLTNGRRIKPPTLTKGRKNTIPPTPSLSHGRRSNHPTLTHGRSSKPPPWAMAGGVTPQ